MASKIKGLVARLIEGKEKSEGYARSTLPSNRWSLFWDILKGRFGKLFIINLLVLLFFIPLFLLLYFRGVLITSYGSLSPFGQGLGVGYAALPSLVGQAERIVFQIDIISYLILPIAMAIAGLGISGGAYVIRNMVWTEGIFVANDFWRGIRQNYKTILPLCLLYSLIFYISALSIASVNQMIATGEGIAWLLYVCKVIVYIAIFFVTIMAFHCITMTVTYELKFTKLIKNSFLFTIGLLPQNLFFGLLGLIPFILTLFGSIFSVIGYVLVIIMGFSLFLLVWTDFAQWAFDKFINDKVPGAKKNRGIYDKVKSTDSEAIKRYKEQMAIVGNSVYSNRPIKPITDDELKIAELPEAFSRADIAKLADSKRAIYEDNERYIEEHKAEFDAQKTEAEKAVEQSKEEREKRIEEAKKELAKREKGKKGK